MLTDTQKLLTICDRLSDVLYGGERGWERGKFEDFVTHCAQAIQDGIRSKAKRLTKELTKETYKMYLAEIGLDKYVTDFIAQPVTLFDDSGFVNNRGRKAGQAKTYNLEIDFELIKNEMESYDKCYVMFNEFTDKDKIRFIGWNKETGPTK